MKRVCFAFVFGMLLFGCGSGKVVTLAEKSAIAVEIDLIDVENDKVKVIVNPGTFTAANVSFYIPKTVPGTYSSDNYGKYIEGFKALDYNGNELKFVKTDNNTWQISNATKLDKVSYLVNDTYDNEGHQKKAVFSPAGTNILKGKNFMLNLHGFVGYFDKLKERPYEITIAKPSELQATTSLVKKEQKNAKEDEDVFIATRYFDVIDNPILYAKSNSETFQINDISVTLSVYSPTGKYTAALLKERMEKMMTAQKAFLAEIDGTKKYNILLYLSQMGDTDAGGFGALEHHTSTVVVLPEMMDQDAIEKAMVDVVSHEFFHIVTPLTVHSKEVQYFDFNDPKMSQHLWMYEGTTEYFANLFQIQQGLISEEEFYERMVGKIGNAKGYDDTMSFTEMSKNILEEPFKNSYANVYEKGALINMALDITLRELSNGEKGVLWLMKQLSQKYGKTIPFDDDKLFEEIVALTYPEIGAFFETHVIGKTPINYNKYFDKAGLSFSTIEKQSGYFLDGDVPFIDVKPTDQNVIFVRKGINLNSFFNELGVKGGDVLKSVNGKDITLESMREVIMASFKWSPEDAITMVVKRGEEEITLEGKTVLPMLKVDVISPDTKASKKQLELRNSWLKGI